MSPPKRPEPLGKRAIALLQRLAAVDNYDNPFTSYRTTEATRFRAFLSRVAVALQVTKTQTYNRWKATNACKASALELQQATREAREAISADAEAPDAGDEEVDAEGADADARGEAAAANANTLHTGEEDDVGNEEASADGAGLNDEDEGAAAPPVNEPDGEGEDAEEEEDDGGCAGSAKDVSPPPPTPEAAYAPAPPLSGSRKRRLSYSEADTKRTRGNDEAVQLPVVAGSRKRTLEGWDEDSDRDNTGACVAGVGGTPVS